MIESNERAMPELSITSRASARWLAPIVGAPRVAGAAGAAGVAAGF